MSHLSYRPALLLAALSLTVGCAGDRKTPESPASEAADQAPVMKTTAPAAEDSAPAPNGQPQGLPPAAPPPQGLNGSSSTENNALAAPTVGNREPDGTKLSEDQIARIAELVNTAEVEQGKLAQTKASSPRVKAFAAKMVNHHGHAKAEQAKLSRKLHLTSAESPEATTWRRDGEQTLATLKSAPAAGFDVAYIDSQVSGHEKALATIDAQLLPSAKTDSVVSALKVARDAVAAHLEEAKAIQAELGKTSSK